MDDERTEQEPEPDHLVLSSPAQFKALGHPLRHRMVNVLRQRPATLRQLTAALGLTKGTISYHVRVLREAGLVRLAETRQVRGGTEQYFALVSRGFRLDEDAGVGPEFLINAALAEMLPERPGQAEHTLLRHLWLTPDEAHALAARLQVHATEPVPAAEPVPATEQPPATERAAATEPQSGGERPRSEPYGLLISLYLADIPGLPSDEDD